MPKKGFVQLIPLFVVAVVLVGVAASLSAYQQSSQKTAVGKVLSDRSGGDDSGGDHGGSSGSSNFSSENRISGNSDSNKQEAKLEVKTENKAEKPEKVEIKETEIEQEPPQGDNGEGSKSAKVKEKEDIEIATGSGFLQHGEKVRTNFPLTVDPATGQLFVTTPKGTKAVAILPAVAIENMIKAGILTTVSNGGESTPPGATGSATPAASVLGATTELTTDSKGTLVYKINGEKSEHFLGILPVNFKLTAVVSAENGQLVATQESLFTRLLDLLSS